MSGPRGECDLAVVGAGILGLATARALAHRPPQLSLQALQRAEQMLLSAPPETAQGLVAQVSNARQAWRSAETATADAYIDYNNAVFRLKRLVGDSDVPPPNPTATQIPVQTVGPAFGR